MAYSIDAAAAGEATAAAAAAATAEGEATADAATARGIIQKESKVLGALSQRDSALQPRVGRVK